MPRYYFHIRLENEFLDDPEGTELALLDHAQEEATQAAQEIMAERLLAGKPIQDAVFEITDESGAVVANVPFRSVVVASTLPEPNTSFRCWRV